MYHVSCEAKFNIYLLLLLLPYHYLLSDENHIVLSDLFFSLETNRLTYRCFNVLHMENINGQCASQMSPMSQSS